MRKHRKFTKQISDGFLARKALTYWRNLIANYDENVSDRDFFDYFGRCDAPGETIKRIRALYTKEQLDEIGYGIARHVASGNVAEALHELWNDRGHRRKTREIVLSVVDDRRRLEDVESVTPGDMAVVRQNLYYLGAKTSNADRIAALASEIESKRIYLPRAIGFGK